MKASILSVVAALSILGVAGTAAAINKCANVDIKATNKHPSGDPVKVLYVKYQVNGAGSWYKEDFSDKVPNNGNTVSWSNQDLQNLPEGSGANFRVYFKRQLTSGTIPKYDDTHFQEFTRTGSTCTDGRSYSFTIDSVGTKGE
ncbi:MAG: hypothetical protein R3B70_06955 [Polyangiaceae bacterium]